MDEKMWVVATVSALIGAGGISTLIPFLKLKQDKESSMVIGAQAAVVSLTAALKQSEARVTKLEEENKFLTNEIDKLVKDVALAKKNMAELTKQLQETKKELDFILKKNAE